ncbi:MAG: hypothetical protein ABEH90_07875 [Halolamina sp.]
MSAHSGSAEPARRAQANVVGVALLLAITTVSLGVLTAGVGTVVESNAAAADANRVSDTFTGIQPSKATGVERHRLAFGEGSLRVVARTVRVLDGGGVVASHRADALVFESGDRRVTFLAGAVLRGDGDAARVVERPPLSTADSLLVVGLPVLNASGPDSVSGSGATRLTLKIDATHERRSLDDGRYRVAVETATPPAWERYFASVGANTSSRDFDGDGVPSVVATYPGDRTAYLVVHDARLEVQP